MSLSNCSRELSVVFFLVLIIINLYSFDVSSSLVVGLIIAVLLYYSCCMWKNSDICTEKDAEFSLIIIFIISLYISVFFFSFSPTHIIVEPDSINETFTCNNGVNKLIKTISIKSLCIDQVRININVEGNKIKDTRLLVNELRTATDNILDDVASIKNIKKDSANSIKTNVENIKKNITHLDSGASNLSDIFKNISLDIEYISNNISYIEHETTEGKNITTKDPLKDLMSQIASIKSNISHDGAIFVSLSSNPQIESGEMKFVSAEIDSSLATTNGEYNGALVIEANDKKLYKEIPIAFKIEGAEGNSVGSKSEENKSITSYNITLNVTGSLGS